MRSFSPKVFIRGIHPNPQKLQPHSQSRTEGDYILPWVSWDEWKQLSNLVSSKNRQERRKAIKIVTTIPPFDVISPPSRSKHGNLKQRVHLLCPLPPSFSPYGIQKWTMKRAKA